MKKLLILMCLVFVTPVSADSEHSKLSVDKSIQSNPQIKKLIKDIKQETEEMTDVNDVLVEKRNVRTSLKSQVQSQQTKQAELEKSKSDLEAQITQLNAEIDQLKKEKAAREAKEQAEREAKAKAEREAEEKRLAEQAQAKTQTTTAQSYGSGQEREAFERITKELGLSQAEINIWADIITRESGWSATATNPSSGAYGIGQALPGSKMAPYGSDYMTNPYTQLKWMHAYIIGRYGSFQNLANFWSTHHWY